MVISLFLTLALFARCFLSLLSERIAKVERADSRRYRAVGGTPIQHYMAKLQQSSILVSGPSYGFSRSVIHKMPCLAEIFSSQNMLSWKFYPDEHTHQMQPF